MTSGAVRIQVGGTLQPEHHVYIVREEDRQVLDLLLSRQFCNILTSRQMGKSSLMARAAKTLQARGIAVAVVDLAGEIGDEGVQDLAYRALLDKIRRDLSIDVDLDEWWDEQQAGTNNQKLLRFFRDVVGSDPRRKVIFLDEVDATLRLPYSDDLFTALRTIHNERSFEQSYEALTFCILGVATPNELVKDRRTTAYNIGNTIALRDFDEERDDLSELLAVLDDDPVAAGALLRRILEWTGGHPYLTLQFSQRLAKQTPEDVDRYAEEHYSSLEQVRSDFHFEQILRFLETRMTEGAAALALLKKVLRGEAVPDRPTLAHAQLKLSGIVKTDKQGNLIVRNRLYGRLFDGKWLQSLKPRKAMARLRWTAAAATLAAVVAGGVGYYRAEVVPEKQAAHYYAMRLEQTSSLDDARDLHAILSGKRDDPRTDRRLSGHEAAADQALARAVDRWLLVQNTAARGRLERFDVAGAFVLAAHAAEKSGRPLDPVVQDAYASCGCGALRTTLRSGSGTLLEGGLAVSADGRRVAAGNAVWSVDAPGEVCTLLTGARLNAVSFGHSGAVYTGDDSGALRAWTCSREIARPATVIMFEGSVADVAASPSATPDFVCGVDGEGAAGECLARPATAGSSGRRDLARPVNAVRFSTDGQYGLTVHGSVMTVWARDFQTRVTKVRAGDDIVAAALAGDTLVAATRDRLLVWSLARQGSPRVFAHKPPLRAVAVSPDGHLVATASDTGIRVYENGTERPWPGPTTNRDPVMAVAFAGTEREPLLALKLPERVELWASSPNAGANQRAASYARAQRQFGFKVDGNGSLEMLVNARISGAGD